MIMNWVPSEYFRKYSAKQSTFASSSEVSISSRIQNAAGLSFNIAQGASPIAANAIDIDDNGGLVVEYMEGPKMRQIESLTTGEISIRVD